MKYCKLRIAWSVVCGLLGLLLIALWVRNYHAMLAADSYLVTLNHRLMQEQFQLDNLRSSIKGGPSRQSASQQFKIARVQQEIAQYRAAQQQQSLLKSVIEQHWFLLLLASSLAAVPWIRRQYSLRTLLAGMTLVAVVLGLAICAAK